MTSNVDIMYDAISEVLSDCDRAEADLQERIGSLKAINADLLETMEAAPIISKYHGHQGFEVERFIKDYDAWVGKRRAFLAKTAPKPVRLGDEGEG